MNLRLLLVVFFGFFGKLETFNFCCFIRHFFQQQQDWPLIVNSHFLNHSKHWYQSLLTVDILSNLYMNPGTLTSVHTDSHHRHTEHLWLAPLSFALLRKTPPVFRQHPQLWWSRALASICLESYCKEKVVTENLLLGQCQAEAIFSPVDSFEDVCRSKSSKCRIFKAFKLSFIDDPVFFLPSLPWAHYVAEAGPWELPPGQTHTHF